MTPETETTLADDLLVGVKDYSSFTGFSERQCFYMLSKGYLPGGKVGSKWLGSKRVVREALGRIAAGEAA